ncbi:MAG: FAD-dependent oxidoreductase [Betaproteobacteria bacterium]
MQTNDFDVIIVGGGLVGLTAALALSRSALKVALVEKDAAPVAVSTDWDARVFAISPASETLLRSLGVWPADDSRLTAVTQMQIFGDRAGSKLQFDAQDAHVGRLATIVENLQLVRSLHQAIEATPIEIFRPARCEAVEFQSAAAVLQLQDGRSLRAKLLVAADGADSWLRQHSGIDAANIDYEQTAVVANFETTLPHRGTAFQWFGSNPNLRSGSSANLGFGSNPNLRFGSDPNLGFGRDPNLGFGSNANMGLGSNANLESSTGVEAELGGDAQRSERDVHPAHQGVLALLPLAGNRVSMVWALDNARAGLLLAAPADTLCGAVRSASHAALGELKCITTPAGFSLRLVRAAKLALPRLAVVGDAAHNLHPLAGQGVNLGFADVQELSAVLGARGPEHDVGALHLLRRYERARREQILAMTIVTHGLQRLFDSAVSPLAWIRNAGLNLTNRLALVKVLLIKQALGAPIYPN